MQFTSTTALKLSSEISIAAGDPFDVIMASTEFHEKETIGSIATMLDPSLKDLSPEEAMTRAMSMARNGTIMFDIGGRLEGESKGRKVMVKIESPDALPLIVIASFIYTAINPDGVRAALEHLNADDEDGRV